MIPSRTCLPPDFRPSHEPRQVWSGDFKELEDVLQKAGKDDEMVQAELHEKCQQQAGHQHMIQVKIGPIAAARL